MALLDRLRRMLGKADAATTRIELGAMDRMHRTEDAVDDATGGRFYDALEKADEEAEDLLERLHLDEPDDETASKRE